VTFGAPISQLADKIKVPTVAIQHKNDIVPKLGLKANPLAENMVTVERVLPITTPVAAVLEAHEIANYTKTAELADESQELGLKRVREQVLERFLPRSAIGVETGEATVYKLERTD
jgi:Xaa-Pro aminopeptidase